MNKKFIFLIIAICLIISSILIFLLCKDTNKDIQIEVYINDIKTETLLTNKSLEYKISLPDNPEDITTNSTSDRYFLYWFNTAGEKITGEEVYKEDTKIYAKFQTVYYDKFSYTTNAGEISINGTSINFAVDYIVVPRVINSMPVVAIGSPFGFMLKGKVIICEGVKTIKANAFKDSRITQIILPSTLETIEAEAFSNSTIKDIAIPKKVTTIGNRGFKDASIKSISFEEDSLLTSIGIEAFNHCANLEQFTLPAGVQILENKTFYNCRKLKTFNFSSNSALTTINEEVFMYCEELLSLVIPENVASIGSYAMNYCSQLNTLSLPNSLESINQALLYCYNLRNITVGSNNPHYESIDNNLINKTSKALIKGNSETIPEGIKIIREYAYKNCSNIRNITLPSSLTTIYSYAFEDCINLQSVYIPNSVTTMSLFVFSGCISLKQINIPTGISTIQAGTFKDCTSLQSIYIPSSITSITSVYGSQTAIPFENCGNLSKVYIASTSVADSITSEDSVGQLCKYATQIYIKDGIFASSYIGANYYHLGGFESIGGAVYYLWLKMSA